MTWARPTELGYDALWCLVAGIVGGSIVTACNGRFKTTDPHESAEEPAMHTRCAACHWAFQSTRIRVTAGPHSLREIADAESRARHQPTTDDWDLYDIGGEA